MITEQRIEKAKQNFKTYRSEGLISKKSDEVAFQMLLKNAKESLKAARLMYSNDFPMWTIVTSYYAMFYMANAVLLSEGYKTGDKIVHKVTADSLIVLVKPKLEEKILDDYEQTKEDALQIAEVKSDELVQSFDYERSKRNTIQYQTTKTKITSKAKTSLKRAKEFIFEMESFMSR
ncbi:MAG: HEPN domain-containing protein [Candidatus Woesearchaeota archaeon]